jgi:hypothetical protein
MLEMPGITIPCDGDCVVDTIAKFAGKWRLCFADFASMSAFRIDHVAVGNSAITGEDDERFTYRCGLICAQFGAE